MHDTLKPLKGESQLGKLFVRGLAFFLVGLQFFVMADNLGFTSWPAKLMMVLSVGIMIYSFYKSIQVAQTEKDETHE